MLKVQQMRAVQKGFFKAGREAQFKERTEFLMLSKKLEKEVDQVIKEKLTDPSPQIPML